MKHLTRRNLLVRSLLAAGYLGAARSGIAATTVTPASLPWHNWSGGLSAAPAGRFAPASEAELLDFLKRHPGPLRPVGAGHSFSSLVPTDGTLVVLDRLDGLHAHDAATLEATFGAGTRLSETGPLLERIGQAMFNLPDIDRQTLAGAIATALDVPGPTLSFHLKELERASIITSRRESRQIFYKANFAGMKALIDFLTEDCCGGHPEVCFSSKRRGRC